MAALAATVFIVGVLTGLTGIGGILVIPALGAFAGLSVQSSMATAMLSFVFVGLAATWLQERRGAIDWAPTVPLSLSAAVFSYLGALANSMASAQWLNLGLSVIIIFAGASVIRPARSGEAFPFDKRKKSHVALMAAIGAGVGFISGLTGVGGPVLSIPAMMALGFAPLASIAAAQVIQVAVTGSGSVGNLLYGSIDFSTATWITLVQLAGLVMGIRMAHTFPANRLRRLVALVCLLVGGFLFVRSLAQWLALG